MTILDSNLFIHFFFFQLVGMINFVPQFLILLKSY